MTEHIELNSYLFEKKMKCPITNAIPISKKFTYCDEIESVQHYPLRCKKYGKQRKILFKKLIKINHKFKYKKYQSIKFILFPYKIHNNIEQKQIQIWNEILSYIKATKRFNNLYGINPKDINKIINI